MLPTSKEFKKSTNTTRSLSLLVSFFCFSISLSLLPLSSSFFPSFSLYFFLSLFLSRKHVITSVLNHKGKGQINRKGRENDREKNDSLEKETMKIERKKES